MSSTGVSSEVRMTVMLPASHFPATTFELSPKRRRKTETHAAQHTCRHAQATDVATGRVRRRDLDHDSSGSALTAARGSVAVDRP